MKTQLPSVKPLRRPLPVRLLLARPLPQAVLTALVLALCALTVSAQSNTSNAGVTMAQPARTTGTITTNTSTITAAATGYGIATVTINGTYAGVNAIFEFSDDSGSNYYTTTCSRSDSSTQETTTGVLTANTSRAWDCSVYAATNFRVRATAYTSGTANVGITLSAAPIEAAPTVGLATGTNTIGALSANQSSNVAQVAGTTTDTNSGNKSAGTQRVVIATDQPALTNKLLVTPDSVALPANQSVNVNQLAGTATDTNSGNKSAGTLRVVIATDQPALTNKLLVTPDANSAVNVAQINGVTPLMGNGVTGTGSQRVTLASDNTANSNPFLAQPVPGTANGASTCVLQSAASTNATNCKNAAGLLYGVEVINTTSALYYLRLYNLTTSPTCSSATGFIRTIPIPHGTGAGAGIANFYTVGETYGTGIGFCLTGGGSSTDNTNAATGVYLTLFYK